MITIYNFGAHGEYLFIAMRGMLEGSDLRAAHGRDGALSAERTLALGLCSLGAGWKLAFRPMD